VLAGLDELPRALATRVIRIELARKRPDEQVQDFYPDEIREETAEFGRQIETWGKVAVDELKRSRPARVPGLRDRLQDCWTPLLAIADMAGGDWPDRAREAAILLSAAGQPPTESLRVALLTDIRAAFGDEERLSSKDLLARLLDDPEAPWGDLRGRPLTERKLAQLLRPFHIHSRTVRMADARAKGYLRESFEDAWTLSLTRGSYP